MSEFPTRRATVAVAGDAALAHELALPLACDPSASDFLLVRQGTRLELHDCRDARLKPLALDFGLADARRYVAAHSRRQPLGRAIGKAQFVADATAGLAQDSLRLMLMGYSVVAIERSAVIAALVQDGLAHAGTGADRLRFMTGDARQLLPALTPRPEVVYLDPMFPAKRRSSAAVRKELQWLRDLVGDDGDAIELFEIARRTATRRVVVKRPDHAPPLAPNPVAGIAGKLVRYDIYATLTK